MTFQKSVVSEKLDRTSGYLDEVENLFRFSAKEILADSEKLHIAERLFQLIVDEIIDINQHFIKELHFDLSNDLEGTFHILGENNILPQDFVLRISPVVGLRNRLVHRYEKLDPKTFIESFQKEYTDFEEYIKFIINYLEK
ncbi:MAG: DUF86 domain-containing protein [Candidatus Gribaldobacteria bacterium]|nr:DUF86 domain-containing protein [Candidatus Gribaldobacteria bacterium]